MTNTLSHTQTFHVEICCNCHVSFAITDTMYRARREDHELFYCPSGHPQHYTGKSDAQKERERAEQAERQLAYANRRAANSDEDARSARASLIATKGHLTRTKNRVAKGVCPCCNRHFADVHRHMTGQHPDYAATQS